MQSDLIEVDEGNFLLVAAQHYNNPQCASTEEFYNDLQRIKYMKRLLNRYLATGELSERLLLNHIIVFFNVFTVPIAVRLLAVKLEYKYWSVLKAYMVFLNYIEPTDLVGIDMDKETINKLREI
jgi:hypothetical protein